MRQGKVVFLLKEIGGGRGDWALLSVFDRMKPLDKGSEFKYFIWLREAGRVAEGNSCLRICWVGEKEVGKWLVLCSNPNSWLLWALLLLGKRTLIEWLAAVGLLLS